MPRNLWKRDRGGGAGSPSTPMVDSTSVNLSQPVVQCVNVTKTFGGVHALREVSVDLMPGRITALVGDNGAGKSTLVKVIGGMYAPDLGHLTVGGKITSNLKPQGTRLSRGSRSYIRICRSATICRRRRTSSSGVNPIETSWG